MTHVCGAFASFLQFESL